MAGETRISQAAETALVAQEPSFLWKLTQTAHMALVSVEPPPTYVRVQQTLETALIEQAPPSGDPALGIGVRHQVLISETKETGVTSVKHTSLIQVQAPFFPAQLSQLRHSALISVDPPLNGIPVSQVAQCALVQTEGPINGSIISQVAHSSLVQLEGPSKAPQVSAVYQTTLFIDTSTASKIRSPSVSHTVLVEEEVASPNADRAKNVISSVSKRVVMPALSSLRSNAIVPTVALFSARAKTFSMNVQSNSLVLQEALLTAKGTHPVDPHSVMSPVMVSSTVVECVRAKPSTNPGSAQSMSNVTSVVAELAKPVVKAQPNSIQSPGLVPQLVLECVKAKIFSSATVASMCEVASSSKLIVMASTYPQSPISDALVKKVSRHVAKVAQYPNMDDLRSPALVSDVLRSTALVNDSYLDPGLIQATTMIGNVSVMTSRSYVARDPATERSANLVRQTMVLVSRSTTPVDPTLKTPTTVFVYGSSIVTAKRAYYFDPLAPDSARRDTYGTYYVVLDN